MEDFIMNKPVCLLRLDNYYFTLIAFIYNDVTKANDLVFIKSLQTIIKIIMSHQTFCKLI